MFLSSNIRESTRWPWGAKDSHKHSHITQTFILSQSISFTLTLTSSKHFRPGPIAAPSYRRDTQFSARLRGYRRRLAQFSRWAVRQNRPARCGHRQPPVNRRIGKVNHPVSAGIKQVNENTISPNRWIKYKIKIKMKWIKILGNKQKV